MDQESQKLFEKIMDALREQYPDLKPSVIKVSDKMFTYELERFGNFTDYIVGYVIDSSGNLIVDWGNAEVTMP
jgi:hypothetical protein